VLHWKQPKQKKHILPIKIFADMYWRWLWPAWLLPGLYASKSSCFYFA